MGVHKKKSVSEIITGGKNTIGIRLPKDNSLNKLLTKLNQPIISTSLNYSGQNEIYNTQKIPEEFTKKIIGVTLLLEP